MSTLLERINIDRTLYVYLQDNSRYWYARFVLFNKWYCKATKETNKDRAIAKAHRIRLEYEVRLETNTLYTSKRFKDVAELTIQKMEMELIHGAGAVSFKDYISILRRYHMTFFDRAYITSLDQEKMLEFEKWRLSKMKRPPTKSTLLKHNAALQRVFTEAVEQKWMLVSQVPILSNKGVAGQRRAAFSVEELNTVVNTIEHMLSNSRTAKTKMIRELLLNYIDFVSNTGLRPGTEIESLTWSDIHMTRQAHQVIFKIKIRKGKTTKHTGTRTIVCKDDVIYTLAELRKRFPHRKPKDKIFTLADGTTTNELGVTFNKALDKCDLKESPDGPRSLYSLRHTYITWQLLSRELRMDILARQCGTSVSMIEQHYSHVVPAMFEAELSGVKFDKLEEAPISRYQRGLQKSFDISINELKQWELALKQRGCI